MFLNYLNLNKTNMKGIFKTLFFLVLVLFLGTKVNAQNIIFKSGMNASSVSGLEDTSPLVGFHLGALADFSISEHFSLETGLLLNTKGVEAREHGVPKTSTNTLRLYYLDIPVSIKGRIKASESISLYGSFGPYLGLGLMGELKTPIETQSIEWGVKYHETKRLDMGLSLGTGIELNSFLLGVSYDLGLNNISNTDTKSSNRVFRVSLGYKLNL